MGKPELPKDAEKQPAKAAKKYRSFTDVFGDGTFYPDVPKIDFKECLGKPFVMFDAKILRDFKSAEYGTHDAALMLLAPVENETEKFTTICSGQVLLQRVDSVIKTHKLPLICMPVYVDDKYYNLL